MQAQRTKTYVCLVQSMTVSALHCRAIYDQSIEDVAWHVGDNNGMPLDTEHPTSDLAKSIAQSNSSDKGGLTSRVTPALRQAAHMESAAEPPQGQDNWQKGSALQTIALDEHDLPTSLPEQQLGLLPTYAEVLLIVLAWQRSTLLGAQLQELPA